MIPTTIVHSGSALALVAALTWGGGDFSGGMAVKRAGGTLAGALRLVFLSHAVGLLFLISLATLRHDPLPRGAALFWGLGAGLLGGVSILAFYLCLARGAMGTSAAISGLLAAAIPSALSAALEGSPGLLRLSGFVVAAASIWFIAAAHSDETHPPGVLPLCLLAGAGFGVYFVALRMAGSAGVVWPLALSRCGSLAVCVFGLAAPHVLRSAQKTAQPHDTPRSIPLSPQAVRWALSGVLLDTTGNLSFIAATRIGRLDTAAVLASLYPASTILLAACLLREHPNRRQVIGMLLAVVAVVLITR